jgi:cell division protein FtsX
MKVAAILAAILLTLAAGQAKAAETALESTVKAISARGDRSTGSPGAEQAAAYIESEFSRLGLKEVGVHEFSLPVLRHSQASIQLAEGQEPRPIHPMLLNRVSPGTIAAPGLVGPLLYVGNGELTSANGKSIAGAIVLMELTSGRNWLNIAALGAKALIYVDRGPTPKFFYEDKMELSPVTFPRFQLSLEEARDYFGAFDDPGRAGLVLPRVRLMSDMQWQQVPGKNIYGLIAGADPKLSEHLIIIEAFYDSSIYAARRSPGADEALSIATLLEVARTLSRHPPARSILLVASDGHAQTLTGMREMIWSMVSRSKDLRDDQKRLKTIASQSEQYLAVLDQAGLDPGQSEPSGDLLKQALTDQIKNEVDRISRQLMRLRLEEKKAADPAIIQQLADERLRLRQLDWKTSFTDFTPEQTKMLARLIPEARNHWKVQLADANRKLKLLKSASAFRELAKSAEPDLVVSLHLSSHGDGVGAFCQGWLHPLKPTINRYPAYSLLNEVLNQGAAEVQAQMGLGALFKDTLRPSRSRPWQSFFLDTPALGAEISALSGMLGVSLVTTHDARADWGTPYDVLERVDWQHAEQQSALICGLMQYLAAAPRLHSDTLPREGFSTVTGHAKFLRHGELFADQPAPGSLLVCYQGPGIYHVTVDATGAFQLKGVADKKHLLDKVIIEGYRFDPVSGQVIWAIDKKQTGKDAYRVKMQRSNMQTDLIMFACRQTTLFNLLEPRTFRHMTKPEIIDGRLEALPLHYWYSRIDTRQSIISSIYLEPGTLLKMTLSDTILKKKMILTNADSEHSLGRGFQIDDWPLLSPTEYLTAKDMWTLLAPRMANLESRGIRDERLHNLQQEGVLALADADSALQDRKYDRFFESARRSWALASRVYDQVEKVQKDVLFGVLFYIALFVPFAFCLERLLFCFRNIYKRIGAFGLILALLIAVIYNVHPAFQLAYSPMVVILAFFIIGLSLMVTLIIFFRFEEEMILLQRHAREMRTEEISTFKAFVAAFFLGVSNLRRHRLRTVLTCSTLIILTFTIMSFTSVKTTRHHTRLQLKPVSPYQGFLLKNFDWQDLAPEALEQLSNAFGPGAVAAPRVWLEAADRTQTVRVPVRFGDRSFEARGMMGLSSAEPQVTGLDRMLIQGRWFTADDPYQIILPRRLADTLGIDLAKAGQPKVNLWGIEFTVVGIFSEEQLAARPDLDGEILTPATFPDEVVQEISEVEMDALESGDEVQTFQSRYQHIASDLTLFIPYQTLLSLGGHFKAFAVRASAGQSMSQSARDLVDRFGLTLFSGENDGIYLTAGGDSLSYSGVPNILIPLVISIFIVLNTMIGSVYERKREIGIYTSVGLAPRHVAFLFIAESMAFAVLSVVLGYLLAQTSAKLFSHTALWAGITVNYSSLSGVAAMILVIIVVLVSTIYPSRIAAKIAMPDVKRSWTMPVTRGTHMEVVLPFLMKAGEDKSAAGYLYDYFRGHQDISHGLFSTGNLTLQFATTPADKTGPGHPAQPEPACPMQDCLQINSLVWLAPFDFGIMQQIELLICHSQDEPGFMEIRLTMKRAAGEANVWRRVCRAFIHQLRRQLLVWRSLAAEQKSEYETMLDLALRKIV